MQILLQNLPFVLTMPELRDLAASSRNGPGAVMNAEFEYIADGRTNGTAVITYADARAAEHAMQVSLLDLDMQHGITCCMYLSLEFLCAIWSSHSCV